MDQVSSLAIKIDSKDAEKAVAALKALGIQADVTDKQMEKLTKDAVRQGTVFGNIVSDGLRRATDVVIDLSHKFQELTRAAADYKDIEEAFGGSGESFASLAVAAAVADVSVKSLGESSAKLTRGLLGVDDETKAAGAALKALGLDIEQFKRLDPASQFEALGKSLDKFADGTAKTAAAQALFGRSGASMLVFLKELNAEGGRTTIVTQDLIDMADEYGDRQKKLNAQLQEYLKVVSTQALPALTALKGAFADVALEVIGVNKETGKLAKDSAIAEFAEKAVRYLGYIIDVADGVVRVFTGIGITIGAVVAAREAFMNGQFTQAKNIIKSLGSDLDDLAQKQTFSARLQERLNKQKEEAGKKPEFNDRRNPVKDNLDFDGKEAKDKKPKKIAGEVTEADLARKDVELIKKQYDAQVNAFKDGEKVVDALRQAGLVDDQTYYQSKLAFLRLNTDETVRQLERENETYKDSLASKKLTGKEQLDFQQKIQDNEIKIQQKRNSLAADEQVLSIQRSAALAQEAKQYRDAEAAAQDYLDTLRRAQSRDIQAFGQSAQERDRTAGRAQIEDKYSQQLQELAKARREAELQGNGQLSEDQQRRYDADLERIRRFQAEALASYDTYFAERLKQEENAATGISRAFQDYIDNANKTSKQVEDAFSKGLGGIEDAFVKLSTGGKASIKDLINSIVADFARMQAKQGIAALLKLAGNYFGDSLSIDTNGIGTNTTGTSLPTSGGRAGGGGVDAFKNYVVGEKGPEILRMGSQGGTVIPNHIAATMGGNSGLNVSIQNNAGVDVRPEVDQNGNLQIMLNKAAAQGAQGGYNKVIKDHVSGTGPSTAALRGRSGVNPSAGLKKRG